MDKLVPGIDYGTDSCRAIVIDTTSGKEVAEHTAFYPRWRKGLYCVPGVSIPLNGFGQKRCMLFAQTKIFLDIGSAQNTMGQGSVSEYNSLPENRGLYRSLYQQYKEFGLFLESKR